uniref:Uncharacterized protein n=1 Tax=Anguilla anguilla TaxID=7936 RepID=A0A0E9TZN6_ANGAN
MSLLLYQLKLSTVPSFLKSTVSLQN